MANTSSLGGVTLDGPNGGYRGAGTTESATTTGTSTTPTSSTANAAPEPTGKTSADTRKVPLPAALQGKKITVKPTQEAKAKGAEKKSSEKGGKEPTEYKSIPTTHKMQDVPATQYTGNRRRFAEGAGRAAGHAAQGPIEPETQAAGPEVRSVSTPKTRETVPVTTRTAVLRYIAGLKKPLTKTERNITGVERVSAFTPAVASVVNTVARHVLQNPDFTIDKDYLTDAQWTAITKAAATRVHERESGETAPTPTSPTTTTTVTFSAAYSQFQTEWKNGYTTKTGKKVAAGTVEKTWSEAFVNAGLLDTESPTFVEAQQAYQGLLEKGSSGDESAQQVLATLTSKNANATRSAAAIAATANGADYFYQQFEAIAANYGVKMTPSTLNTAAAKSAQASSDTYELRVDQVNAFTQQMQQEAATRFPTLRTRILKGTTVKTLTSPYVRLAGTLLGYGGTSGDYGATMQALGINFTQPKWRAFLTGGRSETGKLAGAMSLTEARKLMITTPQYGWQNTDSAKDLNLSAGEQLLQTFGIRKF